MISLQFIYIYYKMMRSLDVYDEAYQNTYSQSIDKKISWKDYKQNWTTDEINAWNELDEDEQESIKNEYKYIVNQK